MGVMMSGNYTVWVGGTEVNDTYLSLADANKLADKYREDGYDDVVVDEVILNDSIDVTCCDIDITK